MSFDQDRYDLDKLKSQVSVFSVLEKAGARFTTGTYMRDEEPFFCPFCDDLGSSKPAGRANDMAGLWHCWSCNRGGDIFTAAQEYLKDRDESAGFNEALQFILDEFPTKEDEDTDPWG